MTKTLKIDVDCANCAQKVEDAINKLKEVNSCTVNFIAGKITIDADDFDAALKKAKKAAKRVEPDCEITE